MSSGLWLDLILLVLLCGYAVTGYRRGLVASVGALAGTLVLGGFGLWVMPLLVERWPDVDASFMWRSIVLWFGVLLLASVGHGLGQAAGLRMRDLVRAPAVRWVDALLGAVASVLVLSAVFWFVAGSVRGSTPSVARAVSTSRVLGTINRAVPAQVGGWFADFQDVLDRGGFPRVFAGLQRENIVPVDPPVPSTAQGPAIRKASRSVVKITGLSNRCQRGQEGSGWVVAPHKVITNAHVVAGMSKVAVQVQGRGHSYTGRAVVFDPQRDLAVIDVSGLSAPPLRQGGVLTRSNPAVVAGFPLDGPFDLEPARVRSLITAEGADIYGHPGATRQVYSLAAKVRPGNSGGPLLQPDGKVAGTVFARSVEDRRTGYALTLKESAPVINAAPGAHTPVSTGECTSK